MGCITVIIFSFTKDYKVFMLCGFCIGTIIMILLFLFVPESPRYYTANNKYKEAVTVYKYLAKLNPNQQAKAMTNYLEEKVNRG